MFYDGDHVCQNDTNIIIHFFGSLCSIFSITCLKLIEKGHTRAGDKETFNQLLLVILSKVNGMDRTVQLKKRCFRADFSHYGYSNTVAVAVL